MILLLRILLSFYTLEDIIRDRIMFRTPTTKTKKSREVKISQKLAELMIEVGLPKIGYLFAGRNGLGYRNRQSADLALLKACDYIGLKRVSTHSFKLVDLLLQENRDAH
ncbi:hypothetical protein [Iningainema tapete]|uniref:Uncharacterized protein n=1 Tax=Iningainema tapete BLCC-T55 TaxID=2748662 RepID=A0A8J6XEB3_9CYAN|nr:hypothetical protein [Iningainema tapete]MBD2774815.1 hypothetical protein [Iningainema tapete BLCC-T55]